MEYSVTEKESGERLDKVLHEYLKSDLKIEGEKTTLEISRAIVRRYIEETTKKDAIVKRSIQTDDEVADDGIIPPGVYVNKKIAKESARVRAGDIITFDENLIEAFAEEERNRISGNLEILPIKGDLNIVFENDRWLVINKPKGIAVHPGTVKNTVTVANIVREYLESKHEFDPMTINAGIVHRLDMSVSGLMIIAKNYDEQVYLQGLFASHKINKFYLAEVEGDGVRKLPLKEWFKVEGEIVRDTTNRRRRRFVASTDEKKGRYSLTYIYRLDDRKLLIEIKTGRNHQIRATLRSMIIGIIGDELYGIKHKTNKSQNIHKDQIKLESIFLGFTDRILGDQFWCINDSLLATIRQSMEVRKL